MAGRPAKPNKVRIQVKIDDGVLASVTDAAGKLDTDRSQVIEDVLIKYLPRHLAAKLSKPAPKRRPPT